jgi:type VI secretion system secreted protein Hcp
MSQQEANQIVQAAQKLRRSRNALKIALPTAAALGAGAAIAVGSIPGSDGTITGCYASPNPTTNANGGLNNVTVNGATEPPGGLRVVDPSLPHTLSNPLGAPPAPNPAAVCDPQQEKQITWNQSGPQGPIGPTGAPGAGGAQGLPGINGQQELLPAVQFGFDNSAGSMFLKLDGVQGESADHKHKGDIQLSSFSFGASNAASQAHGSGAGAGKTSFSSFTITKTLDKSTPLLLKAAVTGEHFKKADVFFARKAGGGQQDFLKIELTDVLVSSYKTNGGGGVPTETISLDGIKGEATFINGHKLSNVLLKLQQGA